MSTRAVASRKRLPLSYTFTNLGDGSIAAVTEATDYTINECQPKPLVPVPSTSPRSSG